VREYQNVEVEVVKERECVLFKCDLCGALADDPKDGLFEWGSVGTSSGSLGWQYTIDGEWNPEHLDLCWDCANQIGETIRFHPMDLLALIRQRCNGRAG
jgi:hypothetical protein